MADDDATLDWDEPTDIDKQLATNFARRVVSESMATREVHALARYALWLRKKLTENTDG